MKYLKEDGGGFGNSAGMGSLRPDSRVGYYPIGGVKTSGGINGWDMGDALSEPKSEFDYELEDDNEECEDDELEININIKSPSSGFVDANDSLSRHNSTHTNSYSFPNAGGLGSTNLTAGHQINGEALLEMYIRELINENSVARGMNPGIGVYSSFGLDGYQAGMQLGKRKGKLGGLGKNVMAPMGSQGGMQHYHGQGYPRKGDDWSRARKRLSDKRAMPDNAQEVSDQWKKEHGLGLTSYQLSQIENKDLDAEWVKDVQSREDEIKMKNKDQKVYKKSKNRIK